MGRGRPIRTQRVGALGTRAIFVFFCQGSVWRNEGKLSGDIHVHMLHPQGRFLRCIEHRQCQCQCQCQRLFGKCVRLAVCCGPSTSSTYGKWLVEASSSGSIAGNSSTDKMNGSFMAVGLGLRGSHPARPEPMTAVMDAVGTM